MKKINFKLVNIVVFALLFSAWSLSAQEGTLVIENGANLYDVIYADTLDNGNYAHEVYQLQNGAYYSMHAGLYITNDFTIVGAEGSGRPAVIVPIADNSGNLPFLYFNVAGDKVTAKFENFIVQGLSQKFATTAALVYNGFRISGDSNRVFFNKMIINGFQGAGIDDPAIGTYSEVRDCKFRNIGDTKTEWSGWAYGHWVRAGSSDTLIMTNNTFINVGNVIAAADGDVDLYRYILFEHNTIFATTVHPFDMAGQINVDMIDNIIYSPYTMGQKATTYIMPDNWSDTIHYGVIGMDTVRGNADRMLEDFGITEEERHWHWKNNVVAWPQVVQEAWNTMDTDGGKVIEPVIQDNYDKAVIDAHLLAVDENTISTDPEFVTETMDFLTKMLDWIDNKRHTAEWVGYKLLVEPSETENDAIKAYVVPWPLPENLAYTNTNLADAASDGYHVGDLNWFPEDKAAWDKDNGVGIRLNKASMIASLSNYPNPFNSTTTIEYTINESSNMTLTVFDIFGKQVEVLVNTNQQAGTYSVEWNGSSLAEGLYFYQLKSGFYTTTNKMVLTK